MPFFNAGIRAAVTVVVLAAAVTAGIATAAQPAVHAKREHTSRHERRKHHARQHQLRRKHTRGSHRRRLHRHHRHHRVRLAYVSRALRGERVVSNVVRSAYSQHRRPTPTTTTPTPTTTTPSGTPLPSGMTGNWSMVFDDEFNGTSLNTNLWSNRNGWTNQNHVTDSAANISEGGGDVTLTLASSISGAAIGSSQNVFAVGDFAEARVYFAGSGTAIDNWPAWWVSGPNWPAAGESDVAEGLGSLTVNYHSPSGAHNQGTVTGTWSNAFHTYGIYRGSNYCNVYWDGQLVRHFSTDDNGAAQELIFTMGASNILSFGSAGAMKVDYVRVWAHA